MNLRMCFALAAAMTLSSCGISTNVPYMDAFAPEEQSLNLVKITDESSSNILGGSFYTYYYSGEFTKTGIGGSVKNSVYWHATKTLDISPDGEKIAYLSRLNNQDNVMVRSTKPGGFATQRTFRNVDDFTLGNNGKIYFSDKNGSNSYICSVDANAGSLMNQHTSGNVKDSHPVLSAKGDKIYFVRGNSSSGPYIWSLANDGTLTMCARGFNPCIIKNNNDAFYCVRNSADGRSEIWYVDFVKGQESLIISDQNRSFTNPCLSPDGKWIVCTGNSQSSISRKQNLDIFVVRTDGTQLTQLTYHPANDMCPIWSSDGRSIYFVSSRANENNSNNIWRMNFDL